MKSIILASKSPRRKEILEGAGVKFKIIVSDTDESVVSKEISPELYVSQLALLKASSVAKNLSGNYFVIGSDTIVEYKGKFLGKPKNREEAYNMISELSGNVHRVYSGICVFDTKTGRAETDFEQTEVYFKKLTDNQISDYVASEEPYDKAGGYAIQGAASEFVEKIRGDFNNVVGLPLDKLIQLFDKEFNFKLVSNN